MGLSSHFAKLLVLTGTALKLWKKRGLMSLFNVQNNAINKFVISVNSEMAITEPQLRF